MPPESNDDAYQFRALAMGLQRAFAPLAPIINRTRLLSTNAEVNSAHLGDAGAPFAIISRELVYIVRELNTLIADLEQLFADVSRQSAGWLKAERRVRSFQQALARMRGGQAGESAQPALLGSQDVTLVSPLAPGVGASWAEAARASKGNADQRRLWQALADNRERLLRDIGGLLEQMRRTARYVDRLTWVAVRHCHFTAVTARIEATKISDVTKDLTAVAGEIRKLADDIATAEREARSLVIDVQRHGSVVTALIGNEIAALLSGTARETLN
ncbi:MAG TPA: hypothetical protein VKB51_20055 [bacterium]|nr:hypothetical protein [bacterium]